MDLILEPYLIASYLEKCTAEAEPLEKDSMSEQVLVGLCPMKVAVKCPGDRAVDGFCTETRDVEISILKITSGFCASPKGPLFVVILNDSTRYKELPEPSQEQENPSDLTDQVSELKEEFPNIAL